MVNNIHECGLEISPPTLVGRTRAILRSTLQRGREVIDDLQYTKNLIKQAKARSISFFIEDRRSEEINGRSNADAECFRLLALELERLSPRMK